MSSLPDCFRFVRSAAFLTAAYDDSTLDSNPPIPDGNPDVGIGACSGSADCPPGSDVLTGDGGEDSILELAINTNQYGAAPTAAHSFALLRTPSHSFGLLRTPSHSFALLRTPSDFFALRRTPF